MKVFSRIKTDASAIIGIKDKEKLTEQERLQLRKKLRKDSLILGGLGFLGLLLLIILCILKGVWWYAIPFGIVLIVFGWVFWDLDRI